MSHAIDEHYKAYVETLRCAAKDHTCDACDEPISKGHRYYAISWIFYGPGSCKRCLRCQAVHVHLRTLDPYEMWPAEKLDCGEEYTEHWGKEPPPEIADLAFKTPEELQILLDTPRQ